MKTFSKFLEEDYVYTNNKQTRKPGSSIQHTFVFNTANQPPAKVIINNSPKEKTGFVYIPDANGKVGAAGANRFGIPHARQAINIIKKETGLNQLVGRRDTGAGPGRLQTIDI